MRAVFKIILMTLLILGGYMVGYSTQVSPPLKFEGVSIQVIGGTEGHIRHGERGGPYPDTLRVKRPIRIHFMMRSRDLDALAEHFSYLSLSIEFYGPGEDGLLGTGDDELVENVTLNLIDDDGGIDVSTYLSPGLYGIVREFDYQARPVEEGGVTGRLKLIVWAEWSP